MPVVKNQQMITALRTKNIVIKGIQYVRDAHPNLHLHGHELHTGLHRTAMTVLTPPGFRKGKGPGPHGVTRCKRRYELPGSSVSLVRTHRRVRHHENDHEP